MADKKKEESKVVLERVYNVPLRKEFLKAPNWNRTKKASIALRQFIQKHMKSDTVKIGKYLNDYLWKDGIKKPPHHVKVSCKKDEEGVVRVEIVGAPVEVKEEKKTTKKAADSKAEEDKSEQQEQAQAIEKEEIKEIAKEKPKTHAPKVMPTQSKAPAVKQKIPARA